MAPASSTNPLLRRTGTYPFQRLTAARRRLAEDRPDVAGGLVDLGAGEPREETPAFIRRALLAAVEAETVSSYPLAEGLPELRVAVADWVARRFQTTLDPDRHVLPTLGSKELIFGLPQVVVDREGGRDLVGVPRPGYPVYERGARFAGARVLDLPLLAENAFLPDLDRITDEDWSRLALIWTNYPNNPTAAVAGGDWYVRAAALCRRHGVLLASDEAYSELWFTGEAPASALGVAAGGGGLDGIVVVNTLSKRSSMPGYRSGFVAGDPGVIEALKRFRPSVGVAPQAFVQRAAIAAWADEDHVAQVRERYREKLRVLGPGLEALGLRDAGGPASFFRWMALPQDWTAEPWAAEALGDPLVAELGGILSDGAGNDRGSAAFAACLLRSGIAVAPGAFFGLAGEGHVRVALVPTVEACARAAERLAGLARM